MVEEESGRQHPINDFLGVGGCRLSTSCGSRSRLRQLLSSPLQSRCSGRIEGDIKLVVPLPGHAERLVVFSETLSAVGMEHGEVGFIALIDVRYRPDEAACEV
jgi:hypothetical protein